jgi:hypothetical protein
VPPPSPPAAEPAGDLPVLEELPPAPAARPAPPPGKGKGDLDDIMALLNRKR